jgi:hypothetical protein
MSLTIFLAFCILGLDFMIYALFKLFFGDRRGVIARRVAAQREVAKAEAAGLTFVPARKRASTQQEPNRSPASSVSIIDSKKFFPRNSYRTRIARPRSIRTQNQWHKVIEIGRT